MERQTKPVTGKLKQIGDVKELAPNFYGVGIKLDGAPEWNSYISGDEEDATKFYIRAKKFVGQNVVIELYEHKGRWNVATIELSVEQAPAQAPSPKPQPVFRGNKPVDDGKDWDSINGEKDDNITLKTCYNGAIQMALFFAEHNPQELTGVPNTKVTVEKMHQWITTFSEKLWIDYKTLKEKFIK